MPAPAFPLALGVTAAIVLVAGMWAAMMGMLVAVDAPYGDRPADDRRAGVRIAVAGVAAFCAAAAFLCRCLL